MANLDDVKKKIEEQLGVPASLLNGETVADNLKMARALINFKYRGQANADTSNAVDSPKSTREQFADWFIAKTSPLRVDPADDLERKLDALETELNNPYPVVRDSGEAKMSYTPAPREQFEEWFGQVSSSDLDAFL